MTNLQTFFVTLILICVIIGVAFMIIDWVVHISMTKDFGARDGIKYTGFFKFKKEWNSVEWVEVDGFKGSCEGVDEDYGQAAQNSYHANIITINSVGIIINNPFSYFIVKLYVKLKMRNKR